MGLDTRGRRRRGEEPEPWRVEGSVRRRTRSLGAAARKIWWVLPIMLAVNLWLGSQVGDRPDPVEVPYTFFREQVEAGKVREVSSAADVIHGEFKSPIRYPAGEGAPREEFETRRPEFADDALLGMLVEQGVEVDAKKPEPERPLWLVLLVSIVPTLLLVGLLVLFLRKAAGGGMAGLGRSKAKRYTRTSGRTTFADVAGIEEAENELVEIVDFLRDPERYRRLGAVIPKGVLLSGPPGTGKTLLARAVAGEADVPFYSLSASEFIEMVAGVGASRVRDLFAQAKQDAPAIIFIDELDAIGRSRATGSGSGAALDEREQTLNQILTEMDGFSASVGVIVLAATNRPETLDAALLRPGRFDRRIVVGAPDQVGRLKILHVHTRNVPLADENDIARVAARTPGMVGADLKNLVNEAALLAAREGHDTVTLENFHAALEKIVLGAERRITISPEERERTAFHESGHALLGMIEPGADPVRKVSIVPRGQALGITFQSPIADRYNYSAEDLRGRIVGALGGRAAEQLIYGNVTTGAESDLEVVTRLARHMVGRWGMSEAVGLVSVLPPHGSQGFEPAGMVADATRELVDEEVRRIVRECYNEALSRLDAHRRQLNSLAEALLEYETLDEEDAYAAAGLEWIDHHADQAADAGLNGNGKIHIARRTAPPLID